MQTTSLTTSTPHFSSTEESILKLLGQGVPAHQVALAIGVSESRISQLISDDTFASRLSELRLQSLTKHNARDDRYDSLEDKILTMMESSIPMVLDPMKQALILSRVNAMKRRGASGADVSATQKQQIVSLQLPVNIINKFSTNSASQVISINGPNGPQSMVTIQSGQIKKLAAEAAIKREETREVMREKEMRELEQQNEQAIDIQTKRNLSKFGFD